MVTSAAPQLGLKVLGDEAFLFQLGTARGVIEGTLLICHHPAFALSPSISVDVVPSHMWLAIVQWI